MLKNNLFIKLFIVALALTPVIAPAVALAYTTPNIWPTGYWGQAQNGNPAGLISCTGDYLSQDKNAHPCQSLCDLINTAINIIYFAMSVAIFIIAPILFIIGGILLMISSGNPTMLEKGRKTLTDTVIGLVIVLCSYLIVNTVITTLQINGIGGFGAGTCTLGGGSATTGSGSSAAAGGNTNTSAQTTPSQGFTGFGGQGGGFGGGGAGGSY